MPDHTILVVEDDPDSLLGLTLLLKKKGGYRVVGVTDAVQAMMAARREEPDLIILDLGLPGSRGFHLLKTMKSNVFLACTPIIILTAQNASLEAEALEAGAEAFFQKPAEPEAFLETIRGALGVPI